jgi:hypothetical protein
VSARCPQIKRRKKGKKEMEKKHKKNIENIKKALGNCEATCRVAAVLKRCPL